MFGIAKFNLLIIVLMKVGWQDVSRFAYTAYVIGQKDEQFEKMTFIRGILFYSTILDIRDFQFSLHPFTYVIKPKVVNVLNVLQGLNLKIENAEFLNSSTQCPQ